MQYIELAGMNFPVIGQVERKTGEIVPLIEINMMSDERWKQLTEESAVKHFREWYGREPESVQEALDAQRAFIENLEREEKSLREQRGPAKWIAKNGGVRYLKSIVMKLLRLM